ncbi:MAG TPA: YCF48-related protein [Ignavibacteria bacterium]|nr:YCF48-related protein [Ignavibacteria bacterium]
MIGSKKKYLLKYPVFIFYFNFSIILISVLYSDVHSQSYWKSISSPVNTNLRNCVFTDNLNGWAAGDEGVIIHTSNGGNTFAIQNSGISYYINDIFFLNNRLGWVVANEFLFSGTTILSTSNGGTNWTSSLFPDTSKFFRTIYFRDSLNGFMGGFGGAIYKTTNAGVSWISSNIDSSEFSGFPVSRITFSSPLIGFACGGYTDVAGVIWRTSDGGFIWSAGAYSPEPFYDFYVKDPERLICAGGDFEYGVQITSTSNAGLNWVYSSLKLFGQAYSIDFRTPYEGWMSLGYSLNWAVTYDSGNSWINIPVPDKAEIYSVDFTDSLHGWAVGNNGAVLKYVPAKVRIDFGNTLIPESFSLDQNYPNPFNPSTVIRYTLIENGFTGLKIYDQLGKEIAVIVNENQQAGIYYEKFDGSNLPGGIYFYTLSSGNTSVTKKMVIIK